MVQLYPLLFEPSIHAKVWGGQWLGAELGKELPPDQPIGESWEIYWKNRIANGAFRGKTLGEVIAAQPEAMVGETTSTGEYPLLVKFIDAQDWLSVQVHPDDRLAAQLEGEPRGKTECWYIIHAREDAQIAYGLSIPLDADGFKAAINEGRAADVLQYVRVQAGDFVSVPAGTLHAIGPGILLYELQQTSDTTYRAYDWDRVGLDGKPRELHLDKTLIATHYDVNPVAKVPYETREPVADVKGSTLIQNEYFTLNKLTLQAEYRLNTTGTNGKRAHLLTAISGHVEWRTSSHAPVLMPQGTSAFIPAGIGEYRLIPDGDAEVLVAWNV